jgi:hypothetical protein
LPFWLIYVESYINSFVVKPPSFTFTKVFKVNDLFNSLLLIVLVFVFILD